MAWQAAALHYSDLCLGGDELLCRECVFVRRGYHLVMLCESPEQRHTLRSARHSLESTPVLPPPTP